MRDDVGKAAVDLGDLFFGQHDSHQVMAAAAQGLRNVQAEQAGFLHQVDGVPPFLGVAGLTIDVADGPEISRATPAAVSRTAFAQA